MSEPEKAFTDALARGAAQAPVMPGLDAAELVARAGHRRGTGLRWLAAAAAAVLVAGIAVGAVLLNRGGPVAAVPARQPSPAGAHLDLGGSRWQLATLAGESAQPLSAAPLPDLRFGFDSDMNGGDGCNTISGGVSIDGDRLRFEYFVSTLMACKDRPAVDPTQYAAALRATAAAGVDGNRLTLRDAAGAELATLVSAPAQVTDVRALTGRRWVPGTLLGKPVPDLEFVHPYVEFADGRVSGHDGCTALDLTYRLEDGQLRFGEQYSMAVCDFKEPISVPEDLWAAFDRTRSAERFLDADGVPRLVLLDADGTQVAEFGAAAVTSTEPTVPVPETSATEEPETGLVTPFEPGTSEPGPSTPVASLPTPSTGPGPTVIHQTRWLDDAPAEVADQSGRTSCGEELLDQGEELSAEALDCFAAGLRTAGVELAFTVPTVEGDPIVYFVLGGADSDRISIWESTHWDHFGADSWGHRTCAGSAATSLRSLLTCGA
jgi:heat shock protein HslJ